MWMQSKERRRRGVRCNRKVRGKMRGSKRRKRRGGGGGRRRRGGGEEGEGRGGEEEDGWLKGR